MQLTNIPADQHENVIGAYWYMMRECESKAADENCAVLKLQVEGFYRLWNKMTDDNKQPIWVIEKDDGK
jgi:hypothetical protein